MECFYDTLFEVSCEGIDALRQVPCLYNYNVSNWQRTPGGEWQWVPAIWDPGFRNRMTWITKCANAAFGGLHHFDDIKNNRSTYFIKVEQIYVPVRFHWGWGIQAQYVQFPQCYYIGTYPNYWGFKDQKIYYPHELPIGATAQMGKTPRMFDMEALAKSADLFKKTGIYGQPIEDYVPPTRAEEIKYLANKYGYESINYYFHPENIPAGTTPEKMAQIQSTNKAIEEDLLHTAIFHNPKQLDAYFHQLFKLDQRLNTYNSCVKVKIPKPTKKPRFNEPPQEGTQKPIEPPPVDRAPYQRTGPGAVPPEKAILNLPLNYGEKHGTAYPTLNIQIWFYWT